MAAMTSVVKAMTSHTAKFITLLPCIGWTMSIIMLKGVLKSV